LELPHLRLTFGFPQLYVRFSCLCVSIHQSVVRPNNFRRSPAATPATLWLCYIASEFYYWLKNSGFNHDEQTSSALVLRLTKSKKFLTTMKLLHELKEEGIKLPLRVYNEFIMFASIQKKFKTTHRDFHVIKDTGL
jgi:hypothetical protein